MACPQIDGIDQGFRYAFVPHRRRHIKTFDKNDRTGVAAVDIVAPQRRLGKGDRVAPPVQRDESNKIAPARQHIGNVVMMIGDGRIGPERGAHPRPGRCMNGSSAHNLRRPPAHREVWYPGSMSSVTQPCT